MCFLGPTRTTGTWYDCLAIRACNSVGEILMSVKSQVGIARSTRAYTEGTVLQGPKAK